MVGTPHIVIGTPHLVLTGDNRWKLWRCCDTIPFETHDDFHPARVLYRRLPDGQERWATSCGDPKCSAEHRFACAKCGKTFTYKQ